MTEPNSEPVICPCGFFGRPETSGLCSKCYRDNQQKKGAEAAPEKANSSSTVSADVFSKAIAQVATPSSSAAASSTSGLPEGATAKEETEKPAEADPAAIQGTDTNGAEEGTSNGTKRDIAEEEPVDPDKPVQKNKKRCFKCNCKLQPAIREIGRCKCDYVFCQLHRLPEQHDCMYDHKEKGRQEARQKMVSPKKHVGTSLKRLDSDS